MDSLLTFVLLASSGFLLVSSDMTTWQVEQGGNVCILAEFNADFNISYWAEASQRAGPYQTNVTLAVPSTATVSPRSVCSPPDPTAQDLVITWPAKTPGAQPFNLTVHFTYTALNATYTIEKVSVEYDLADNVTFPLAVDPKTREAHTTGELVPVVKQNNTWQCLSREKVTLIAGDGPAYVVFSNVKVEAFRMGSDATWVDPVVSCADDQPTTVSTPSTTETSTTSTETTTTSTSTTSMPTTMSTTLAPGPAADWWVQNPSNTSKCVLASFIALLDIQYTANNGTANYTATTTIGTANSTLTIAPGSSCMNSTVYNTTENQAIVLQWTTKGNYQYMLSFLFEKQANGTTGISHVSVVYDLRDAANFPNALMDPTYGPVRVASSDATVAVIESGMFLRCNTGLLAKLKETKEMLPVGVTTFYSMFEAFRMSNTSTFDDKEQVCPQDLTSTTVTTAASTTPQPGPKAQWMVKDPATGDQCILSTLNATFLITYNATNTQTKAFYNRNTTFTLPDTSMLSVDTGRSFCNAGTTVPTQRLVLTWTHATTYRYNLTLDFQTDNTTGKTAVDRVTLEYDLNDQEYFPEATMDEKLGNLRTAVSDGVVVRIGGHMYLKCDSGVPASLTETREKKSVGVMMTGVKLEAFRMSKTETFDDAADVCPGDLVPTTTPMPVTSTKKPVQLPVYNVTEGGVVCLQATFDMTMIIQYFNHSGAVMTDTQNNLNNATVDQTLSRCGNESSILALHNFFPDWILMFNFTHTPTQFYLTNINLQYNLSNYPAANDTRPYYLQTDVKDFTADLGRSYVCHAATKWALNTTNSGHSLKELDVELAQVKVQAFMVNGTLGSEQECAADGGDTSEIVPIAVGCALAALVIIVLIAYVIGRRRNRARGYESM
ncbi:mucin-2-like [Paramacrobiotus metropolitanus]|uniref:mucin-2-like n=1 Tax=Paramacrobiotus metropolitanus TaxID=2943436 RepID=UPI002445B6FA|nr:mucin-2-like [Paramacrobiotus metropolitanus]XP_055339381.1 mucin-2-like [Paramacrobiotus metropolitanus]